MTQEIQNEMDKLKKQINNPSIPDSLKNILRGKLAKLEESVEKTETQVAAIEKKEEQLEKKAEGDLSAAIEKMEKQIKNPSLPESLKEQIKEKLKKAKANVVEVKKEQVEEKKIKEEKIKEVKEEVKETVKEVKKAIEKKSSPKEKEVEVKKAVTVSTEVIKKAKRVKEEASKQVVEKTKKRTTKLKGALRELQAIINANPTLKVLYKGKGVDLKRDAARQAKPIGYRFKGKHNYRIPKNLDNPNVYYEGRPDKGDAYQNKRRGVYFADGGMMAKGGKLKYGQLYIDGKVETIFEPIIGYTLVEKGTGGEKFTVEIFKYPNYGGKGVRYYYYDSRRYESVYSNDLNVVKKIMDETLEKNNEKITKIKYEDRGGMADGGMMEKGGKINYSYTTAHGYTVYRGGKALESFKTEEQAKRFVKDLEKGKMHYADGGMMADGGMTKQREILEEAYKQKLITKKEYEDEISKLFMPRSGAYGKKGISLSIKEYYQNAFPSDDMGADINPNATFKGLMHTIDTGRNVYKYIGVYDSVVRERVFQKLSELTGLDYNVIYDKWLNSDDDMADGGVMARGGKTKKMYYHILEYGNYGNIGYQGYYDTQEEAEKEVKRLQGYFPNLTFQIFVDASRNEPPITTVADGGMMARGGKTSRYNKGLSWHQDHARHNSSEKYEVPVKRRKK